MRFPTDKEFNLRKKGGQWKPVRLLDIAILLLHVHRAASTEEVGFEDTQETLETFTRKLNEMRLIDPNLIESALWACNLLDEVGKFTHPHGLTFDQFVKAALPRAQFDKFYNTLTWREKPNVENQNLVPADSDSGSKV